LLHTAHEPVLTGHTFQADQDRGRIFCRTLLPENATIKKVGGAGKEFWAAGKNWTLVDRGLTPENKAMMGQWRVEVSPGSARQEDFFLHVIQVGDQQLAVMDDMELVRDGRWRGVQLTCGERTVKVTFDTAGDLKMRLD
jgi:heparin/heparan-sulfate lyase